MAVIEDGSGSGKLQKVDVNNNAQVNMPVDPANAGFVRVADANGVGIQTTENGSLNVSEDCPILWEQVDGNALNTNVWATSVSGMTVAQSGGFITMNSGAAMTANSYAILSSIKTIPLYAQLPLRVSFNIKPVVQPQANLTMELGIGTVATNGAPTDGCFFRWNSSTQFLCVVNNGGSETTSGPLTASASNIVEIFEIVLVEDLVEFYVGDVLAATVQVPAGIAYPTNAGRLPIFCRVYNGASPPGQAPQIGIGQVFVAQQAMRQNKTWGETVGVLGRGFYQSPITPFAQTSNHTNSVAPVGITLANTTAGYATLGGKFAINSQAAGATDGVVFAFQNPAGYQMTIYGIAISTAVTGAAIVTATLLDWALGINSSAISLATVDGAGTWAPRRIPLGMQGFIATAGVGTVANDVSRRFDPPIVLDSGRYLHLILTTPNGAATGSLVYRGTATILGGYSE